MEDEVHALEQNETWKHIPLSVKKKAVECWFAYTIGLNPDRNLARLKDHLVPKGCSQINDVDDLDTFIVVEKMASAWLLISLVATHS